VQAAAPVRRRRKGPGVAAAVGSSDIFVKAPGGEQELHMVIYVMSSTKTSETNKVEVDCGDTMGYITRGCPSLLAKLVYWDA